ncbi:MAG: Bax inhibitor-1/YccA family protein [Aestuariivirga sp.]
MSDFRGYPQAGARSVGVDQGLRAYMIRVYNYMAMGLVITGLAAFGTLNSGLMPVLFGTPLKYVVLLAPLAMVMLLSFRVQTMSLSGAQIAFWVFSALMGISLTPIVLVYTGASIAKVFFITAAAFASTSLYGYTTKRDMTGFGSFLFMGLIGIVIASVVNIFLQSSAMSFALSVIGVLVFTGLTAWDTQQIKTMYYSTSGEASIGKSAVMGALRLYLDFINLFMSLLRLMGDRR